MLLTSFQSTCMKRNVCFLVFCAQKVKNGCYVDFRATSADPGTIHILCAFAASLLCVEAYMYILLFVAMDRFLSPPCSRVSLNTTTRMSFSFSPLLSKTTLQFHHAWSPDAGFTTNKTGLSDALCLPYLSRITMCTARFNLTLSIPQTF